MFCRCFACQQAISINLIYRIHLKTVEKRIAFLNKSDSLIWDAMDIIDECITWGKRRVDPWNRVSCCQKPVILLVEFCQIQGPRPLHCYPSNSFPHLDLDNIAIWLMSSESVQGSTVLLYNQQTALYACIYHSILLDIRARGFQKVAHKNSGLEQGNGHNAHEMMIHDVYEHSLSFDLLFMRPICLALLSVSKPTSSLLKSFMNRCQEIFTPIIVCNRNLFKFHASALFDFCDAVASLSPNSSTSLNMTKSSTLTRIESLLVQARQLLPKIEIVLNTIGKKAGIDGCASHTMESLNEWLNAFGTPYSAPLLDINHLMPCVFNTFIKAINNSYELFTKIDKTRRNGSLYCGDRAVLILKNYCMSTPNSTNFEWLEGNDYSDRENTLRAVVDKLDQILYPVLSGGRLALCASDQRKPAAMDLLQKLIMLNITAVNDNAFWIGEGENIPSFCSIFGQSVSRLQSAHWSAEHVDAVFDMNGNRLRSKEYNGTLLSTLSDKRFDSFPSDRSIIAFVTALLTDFCSLVYLAKFKGAEQICEAVKLHKDDAAILVNLLTQLDFIKYNKLRDTVRESVKSDPRLLRF
ncbi:unnamed protein product [Dracunculus medinensis]|uniref:UDENN FLCN/SMCR8-type domain-containing protein n=1 Tax=Dracunculus medinensis TaxID=318479 RepID=A0A0N4UQL2_DRAME|nr:unnamed protein product [Dracunculus medinensis]